MATAARRSGLPELTAVHMMETLAEDYELNRAFAKGN